MDFRAPLLVPAVQPIELFFFLRVFQQLCRKQECRHQVVESMVGKPDYKDMEMVEVPLVDFQRAITRLFHVIRDGRTFNIADYDFNRNGRVGWSEFCHLWMEQGVCVRLTPAERFFLTLEDGDRSLLGKLWSMLIFGAICLSTGSFIASTLPEFQTPCPLPGDANYDEHCKPQTQAAIKGIDSATIMLFTVEYFTRLILSAYTRSECVEWEKNQLLAWMVSDAAVSLPSKTSRVLQWVLHWANIIDLAAILPWYLSQAFETTGSAQSPILKMLRLSRVIRAFRLGRRFEAVVVIMRSLRRSLRALYVLLLNLVLGMIFFGALMYFAEQGMWDPRTQAYLRWEGPDEYSRSPFESIPACFWWAIVTATTIGYGDNHTPTTAPGKAVAGLTMVWSLCVLALPIGVVGGNFSQVWQEYDKMQCQERETELQDKIMLEKSLRWGDRLHQCRQLLLEVWHDTGLASGPLDVSQSEFLGEVHYTLELSPHEPVRKMVQLPLAQNSEKAARRVRGTLTFEYSWQPLIGKSDAEVLLQGSLVITVVGADDIVLVDWNGAGLTDPYCTVRAYPTSPVKGSQAEHAVRRTGTLYSTTTPVWNVDVSWDMCWMKSASRTSTRSSEGRREPKGQFNDGLHGTSARSQDLLSDATPDSDKGWSHNSQEDNWDEEVTDLLDILPHLHTEVGELSDALPQLRGEVANIRRELQLALAALEHQTAETAGQQAALECGSS